MFVDEKNIAVQMIVHGERIATNGDVRLMPTPGQWDLGPPSSIDVKPTKA